MSETQGFERFSAEIATSFCLIGKALYNMGKGHEDFFKSRYIDGEKSYYELNSLLDGQTFKCFSKEEVNQSTADIVKNTELYEGLKKRIVNSTNLESINPARFKNISIWSLAEGGYAMRGEVDGIMVGPRNLMKDDINVFISTPKNFTLMAKKYLSPTGEELNIALFNALGGHQSEMLTNTKHIELLPENKLKFNIRPGSSDYSFIVLSENDLGAFKIDFIGNANSLSLHDVKLNELRDVIQGNAKIEHINPITASTKANVDKIKKHELFKAGLKWDDLSFSDQKKLISGKETSTITVSAKDANGKEKHYRGSLSLKGNPDNTFSFAFKPSQNQIIPQIKRTF